MWTQKRESPLYIVIDIVKGRIGIMKYGHKRGKFLYYEMWTQKRKFSLYIIL